MAKVKAEQAGVPSDQTSQRTRIIGRLAVANGVVGCVNILTIFLMYTIAAFFGPLNDLGNGIAGILNAALAWLLYPLYRGQSKPAGQLALTAAIVGAGLVVVGSGFVIFGVTGWFTAGLYSVLGNAVIGVWVVVINRLAQRSNAWPRRLTQFGVLIGVIMVLGVFAAPAILRHVASQVGMPWYVIVAYASSVGWFLLLPVWSVWLGRFLLSDRAVAQVA